jgi:hypothetical protein
MSSGHSRLNGTTYPTIRSGGILPSSDGPKGLPMPITQNGVESSAGIQSKRRWLDLWKPSDFAAFEPSADFMLMGDCHLTRGGITVLGGWPGVGKSRAALGLAIAGATGRDWLGHKIHARFRTLLIQIENGEWRLKHELAEAIQNEDLDEWLRITPPPPYGLAFHEAGFREQVATIIREFRPGLVIIDPWNRVAEGDKQGDYRQALEAILECLPGDPAEKPAVLIIHHMRKKGSDAIRKQGRDLLHELAGSYQIGSAARCVFVLEPGSSDTTDPSVVLTCCKNNDGREGEPSAWIRRNGLFTSAVDFDMVAFLEVDTSTRGRSTPDGAVARALRGMNGDTKAAAVRRLVSAGVCAKSKAYAILASHPNVEEDEAGKLWWREEME